MSSRPKTSAVACGRTKSKQIIETARTERKLKLEKATNDAEFEINQLLQTQTEELLHMNNNLPPIAIRNLLYWKEKNKNRFVI